MKEFDALLAVAEKLHGEGGCPWDQIQTCQTLRSYVLEEAHEVIDAVDRGTDEELVEELGDLLYVVVFYAKIGEKEGRFSLKEIINAVREKLIRRHPHIFEDSRSATIEEVKQRWEAIKKEEKKGKSIQQEVTLALPALQKAQKVLKKRQIPLLSEGETLEEKLVIELLSIAKIANEEEIDLEIALTTFCNRILAGN